MPVPTSPLLSSAPPYPLPSSINLSEESLQGYPIKVPSDIELSSEVKKKNKQLLPFEISFRYRGFICNIFELSIFCLIRPTNFEIDMLKLKCWNAIPIYSDE